MRKHAQVRAMERYGLALTKDTRRAMTEIICTGKARLIDIQSLRVSRWWVPYAGKQYPVAFRKRHEIITFLPEEAFKCPI